MEQFNIAQLKELLGFYQIYSRDLVWCKKHKKGFALCKEAVMLISERHKVWEVLKKEVPKDLIPDLKKELKLPVRNYNSLA